MLERREAYQDFKMLCIDLSLKYLGIQWVSLAESG